MMFIQEFSKRFIHEGPQNWDGVALLSPIIGHYLCKIGEAFTGPNDMYVNWTHRVLKQVKADKEKK